MVTLGVAQSTFRHTFKEVHTRKGPCTFSRRQICFDYQVRNAALQAVEDEDAILRMISAGQKEPKRKLSVSWKATWDEKRSEEAEDAGKGTQQEKGKRRKSINYELFDISRKVSWVFLIGLGTRIAEP